MSASNTARAKLFYQVPLWVRSLGSPLGAGGEWAGGSRSWIKTVFRTTSVIQPIAPAFQSQEGEFLARKAGDLRNRYLIVTEGKTGRGVS